MSLSSLLLASYSPPPPTETYFRSKSASSVATRNNGSTTNNVPSRAASPSSPLSRSSVRHAKCLKPISFPVNRSHQPSSSASKSRMRKQSCKDKSAEGEGTNGYSGTKSVLLPGTAPIAQIRSLPLHISQIRSGVEQRSGQRSSYIINSSKVSTTPAQMACYLISQVKSRKTCHQSHEKSYFAMKTKKGKCSFVFSYSLLFFLCYACSAFSCLF